MLTSEQRYLGNVVYLWSSGYTGQKIVTLYDRDKKVIDSSLPCVQPHPLALARVYYISTIYAEPDQKDPNGKVNKGQTLRRIEDFKQYSGNNSAWCLDNETGLQDRSPYNPEKRKEEEMSNEKKETLYKWNEGKKTVIGRFITEDSTSWIMEVNGQYVAVDPKSVEEIVPYTITVSFTGHNNQDGSPSMKSYRVAEDCGLKQNDMVLVETTNGVRVALVVKINSKNKSASKPEFIQKLVTEDVKV